MGLRMDPVGGGRFQEAMKVILEKESQPIKNLENRKAKVDARLKLFREFKTKFAAMDSALANMSTFKKFRELKVDLGTGKDLVNLVVDNEVAEPGEYEVEIQDLAKRSSLITNGFEDPDDTSIGIGYLTMELENGEDAEIFVPESSASLNGIAKLINNTPGSPVQASVIRDEYDLDQPWRLILTSKKDGERNNIDFPDFYFLNGKIDFYIDDDRSSKNAFLKLNGFEIESEGNNIKNFLNGVNMELLGKRPDEPFFMKITEDYKKIGEKVKDLITKVNEVLDFINKQNQIDEKTDTSTTFAGDSGLQGIEYQIRNLIHREHKIPLDMDENGQFTEYKLARLTDMGIRFERTGQIVFDEQKFEKAMADDFNTVGQAITGPDGLVPELRMFMAGYSRPGDGVLNVRERALQDRIRSIDDQIDRGQRQLERKQNDLVGRFSRLQSTLANLQQQQQYMQASLGGGGNPLSQLLG